MGPGSALLLLPTAYSCSAAITHVSHGARLTPRCYLVLQIAPGTARCTPIWKAGCQRAGCVFMMHARSRRVPPNSADMSPSIVLMQVRHWLQHKHECKAPSGGSGDRA